MSYTYDYPHMAVTVDLVLFDISDAKISILLIKRGNDPFKGSWALPGGYVDMDEGIEAAAIRELNEETGAKIDNLKFIGYFDAINRDPRERTVSFAFLAITNKNHQKIKAADDAADAQWFSIDKIPPLAFDHKKIIACALEALNS
jgi:8-oxo-dGTP diphosphatase